MTSHAFDPLSFVAGLVVTGLGVLGAAGGLAELENLRLGWPLLLIVFGALLVASTIRPGRDAAGSDPEAAPGGADDPAMPDEGLDDPLAGPDEA